jgi:hypothetical protein
MQCFGCGRQSTRTDYCEWCKRPHGPAGPPPSGDGRPPGMQPTQPVPPGAQPTMQMPYGAQPTMPMPGPTRRVALTGEVVEGPPPPPPSAHPMPTQAMPPHGYGNAGLPARAYSPAAIDLQFDTLPPAGERWEKALAFCLSLLALSMLLIHFAPNAIMGVAYADMFLLMLALGATRAIPFFEEAMVDCGIMLVVTFLFGPVVGLIVYLLVGAIKQECNGAIVTLLVVSIVLPQLLAIPLRSSAESLNPFLLIGLFSMLSFLAVFVGFLGWLCASFFRPLNA